MAFSVLVGLASPLQYRSYDARIAATVKHCDYGQWFFFRSVGDHEVGQIGASAR